MAEQGWQVNRLDISPSAVARASAEALARGVDVSFIATDLSTWTTDVRFGLVSPAFCHSIAELTRPESLRRAAERVRDGGTLRRVAPAAPHSRYSQPHRPTKPPNPK